MKNFRRLFIFGLCAVCVPLSTGLVQASVAHKTTTYKIGALAALTGLNAPDGALQREGVEMGVAAVNNGHIIPHGKLDGILADNMADPTTAVSALNQLIAVDHVPASLTTFSSPTLAVLPTAGHHQVVLVNPGGQTPTLEGASPWLFNTVPLVTQQAIVVLDYAIHTKHLKKIALFYSDNDLGNGTLDVFSKYVKGLGGTYVGGVSFPGTATDFRSLLAKVQSLNADAVYITGTSAQSGNMISQAASLGFKPTWLSYEGFAHATSITIGGPAAEGSLYASQSYTDPKTHKVYPSAKPFIARFRAQNNSTALPDYAIATVYDATRLLGTVIGTLVKQHKKVTGNNIRLTLRKVKNFASVYGPMTFQKGGIILQPLTVSTIRNGQFADIKTYSVSQIQQMIAKIKKKK